MFLAVEEMRQNKLRYGLIFGLLCLIAYLVFFLTGLAYGLMQDNRTAIDKWQADSILLSSDANRLLSASKLEEDIEEEVVADETAFLAQKTIAIWEEGNDNADERERASLFGIRKSDFTMPNIVKGRAFEKEFEVVVDESLAETDGFALGDSFEMAGTDEKLTIVGYTDEAFYSVAPTVYMDLDDFQAIMSADNPMAEKQISAIVVKGDVSNYPSDDLEKLAMADFIDKLPGYSAQNITFGFMIGFLIVIAAIVIGIFIFVLTSQKSQIFGLMKIQGLSSGYISRSVLAQTFLLSGIGTGTGLLGTYLSSIVLPSAVPFDNNWLFYVVIAAAMVLFALMGALFSVRTIVKVDPLKSLN